MSALTLALWVALAQSSSAPSQTTTARRYLDAAVSLYNDLEYEGALAKLQRAKQYSNSLEDDVAIGIYEGLALEGMGRFEAGSTAFKEALALKPDAALPKGVSPKVSATFEGLRAQARSRATKGTSGTSAAPAATAVTIPATDRSPGRPWWVLAPGAIGVGLLATSSYFFLQAKTDLDALRGSQPLVNPQSYASAGATAQTVGWTLAGLGAAGLIGTGVLWATHGAPETRPVTARVVFLGTGVGIAGVWR